MEKSGVPGIAVDQAAHRSVRQTLFRTVQCLIITVQFALIVSCLTAFGYFIWLVIKDQPVESAKPNCSVIQESAARLNCYDQQTAALHYPAKGANAPLFANERR